MKYKHQRIAACCLLILFLLPSSAAAMGVTVKEADFPSANATLEETETPSTPCPTVAPSPTDTAEPPPVTPPPIDRVDTVDTVEELQLWLRKHSTNANSNGGAVLLSSDLYIDAFINFDIGIPIQIDTGTHTIFIEPNSKWNVTGPVTILGIGTVLHVKSGGMLSLDRQTVVQSGGDAVYGVVLEDGAIVQSNCGTISATGVSSTAVYSHGDLALSAITVSASGTGTTAIKSIGTTDLTYCRVIADGEGGCAVEAEGEVILDTSYVTPGVPDATTFMRTTIFDQVKCFADMGGTFGPLPTALRAKLHMEGRPDVSLMLPYTHGRRDLDTEQEAIYRFPVAVTLPYPEINLSIPDAVSILHYVFDPQKPRLTSVILYGEMMQLFLYSKRSAAEITVCLSDDGGHSWDEFNLSAEAPFFTLQVPTAIDPGRRYLVYFEERRTEQETVHSNLLELSIALDGSIVSDPSNGDYDGGDRDDTSSPEPPTGWPEEPVAAPSPSIEPKPPSLSQPSIHRLWVYIQALSQELFSERHAPAVPSDSTLSAPTPPNQEQSSAPQFQKPPAELPGNSADKELPQATVVPSPSPIELITQKPLASIAPGSAVSKSEPSVAPKRDPAIAAVAATEIAAPRAKSTAVVGALLFAACIMILLAKWRCKSMSRTLFFLFCAASVIAGICFFLLKFQVDNRYAAGPKAASGVLNLAPRNITAPIFLWDSWAYYPGMFLTPAELEAGAAAPDYTYLGEHGAFTHGKAATYRLTIMGAEDETYAIELPHIYGAYRAWINGEPVSSYGFDGDTPQHASFLQIEPERGVIDIVIAVQARNQLYDGLTTPPLFGRWDQVWTLIQLRAITAALLCGCAAFLGILYLVVGVKTGRKSLAFAFAALCLCYVGSILRIPLSSVLGALPDGLLAVCRVFYFGIFMSTLSIVVEIFQTGKRLKIAVITAAALMCVWVAGFQLFGNTANSPWYSTFSASVEGYKYVVAITMVGTTALAAFRNRTHGYPLLAGSLFFLSALLCDRIYPKYEPAFLHWPVETATLLQIGVVAWVLISDAITVYRDNLRLASEKEAAHLLAVGQARQCTVLADQMNGLAELRHNMRSYLISVLAKCEQKDYEEAEALLRQSLGATAYQRLSSNHLINAILSIMEQEATEHDVLFHMTLGDLPVGLRIEDIDLCILLSNVIRNAIEACDRLPTGMERSASLTLRYRDGQLVFLCSNPQGVPAELQDGRPTTTKKEWGHGLGLKAVHEIVGRYGGLITVESADSFAVRLLLPG